MALPLLIAVQALAVAVTSLQKAMTLGVGLIKDSISFGDKAQKASLALGQTYTDTNNQLGSTMQGLRGSLDKQFGAAIAGMEAGLQGNTAGVARLINQQQLTGTAYQKTAAAFATMETSLGLGRDQTNRLSDSLIKTGNEYQVSTDKLVDGMMALKASFGAMNIAGMGEQVQGAMAELTAAMPAMAPQLQKVMSMVMDTSQEGYRKLTALGMGDVRERLAATKNTAEATAILKEAFVTGAQTTKSIAGDVSKNFFMAGVAQEVLGRGVLDLVQVADQLGKRVRTEGEDALDFGRTLATLKEEILVPIQKALTDHFYPAILNSADALSAAGVKVAKFLGKLIKQIPHVDRIFKKLTLTILDFIIGIINWAGKFFAQMKDLFNKHVKDPLGQLHMAFKILMIPMNLVIGIFYGLMGVVGKLEWAITKVFQAMFELLDWLPGMGKWGVEIEAASKAAAMWNKSSNEWFDKSGEFFKKGFLVEDKTPDSRRKEKGLGDKLLGGIRADFAADRPIRREQNESLRDIASNTSREAWSGPAFIGSTADTIGFAIERVLGFGPGEDLVREGISLQEEQINLTREQTDVLEELSSRRIATSGDE